jgi:hypothetical protein
MNTLRSRLFNPPNAVPDRPLELRNGWPVRPVAPAPEAPPPPPALPPAGFIWPGLLAADCWLPVPPAELQSPFVLERRITMREIIAAVAAEWSVDVMDILSSRRFHRGTVPRHVVMTLARHLTTLSFPRIARALNRKDHTTVLHGVQKYAGAYQTAAGEVGPYASLHVLTAAVRRQVERQQCGAP